MKLNLSNIVAGFRAATGLNALLDQIETAVNTNLSRTSDGSNTMEQSLDMNSNRILNLPEAVGNTEPVTLGQAAAIAGVVVPFTQTTIGETLWPATATETSAGVTVVNAHYQPGDVRRYGTITSGLAGPLQAAIDSGHVVTIPEGSFNLGSTTVEIQSSTVILGAGRAKTTINYTGSGTAFEQKTPGTRIYNVRLENFSLISLTGALGLDLDSVSISQFSNLRVQGFTTGIKIYSPTSGFAVYNRFYNVTASGCGTGFDIVGPSSNANIFVSCRANACTTVGLQIDDSNDNIFTLGQIEACEVGVRFKATLGPGVTSKNQIALTRFESNVTSDIVINTDCVETTLLSNYYVNDTGIVDNGLRTQHVVPLGAYGKHSLHSALAPTDGAPYSFTRTSNGGSNVPCVQILDTVTSTGTPTGLQIESGRPAGHAIRALNGIGGTESFGVLVGGQIRTNQAAANTATPSGATAYQLPIYSNTGTLLGYIPIYAAAWT